MNLFNDYRRMGIRDVAWFIEDCQTMKVGGTHVAMVIMDYRTPDNGLVFDGLIGALGNAQIEAARAIHPAGKGGA